MGSTAPVLVIAVPAALAGAAAMGLANAAQWRATHEVPESGILSPRLIQHLLSNRLWRLSIAATVGGLALQLVSLGFGPLLLIQPLLVTALLFTTVFSAWLAHAKPDRIVEGGALLCLAGLSGFLLVAAPTQSNDRIVAAGRVLPLLITFAVLVIGCLAVAALTEHAARVMCLALATGVLYGVTAALMKLIAGQFRDGLAVPFTQWPLYTACVIGPIGFLLSQHALQEGRLAAPAIAVITTVDPLVGIGIGLTWFGEQVRTSASALAGEATAGCVIIIGIAVLAYRGEHLRQTARAHWR